MRLALTLGLMATLVVLVGCTGGGCCGVADVLAPDAAPAAAPTAYGSASGSASPVAYERAPRVAVREAARSKSRPASRYERTLASFTAPEAPALPGARPVARKVSLRRAPVAQPAPALAPSPSSEDCCPGGNCAVPSFSGECVGGNCAIPSFSFCK